MGRYGWLWIVGGMILLAAGLGWWFLGGATRLEEGSVLVVEVRGEFVDAPVNPLLARLTGRSGRSLMGLLSELRKAERDDRIETVVFEIGALGAGWGKAEEIRDAVAELGEKGKRTVAYLELETLSANRELWVASAAQEVVLAPASRSALLGLAAEYMFLGGLFEKIGVEIEYERIGRYKSAVEAYAESKMSPANREMTTALIDSIDGRFVGGIAEGRGLDVAAVRAAIDEGPSTPQRLVELGIADSVQFFDEWHTAEGEPPLVESDEFAAVDPGDLGMQPEAQFALIYGAGPVVTGSGQTGRNGQPVLAADTVAEAILEAAEADEVQAIIFRVDSPGGSPLASDIVWRAIDRAQQKGKPVVASFSDVAASGGYYVACGADKIVSNATTYTGSIGVFVLRPVLGGLFEKLGIGVESMTRGARADLLISSEPLSDGARAVLENDVQRIYELFVERVAAGRDMETQAVDAIARGRVWTGEQAHERGLVDTVGGIRAAAREAKLLVGLAPDADVALLQYPPPRPLAEQLAEALGLGVRSMTPELPLPRGIRTLLSTLEALPTGVPLLIPPGLAEIH